MIRLFAAHLSLAAFAFAFSLFAIIPLATAQSSEAVRVRNVRVNGPLETSRARQVADATTGEYSRCVAERVAETGRLAGELRLRVHVEEDGIPIFAAVDWTNVGDRALERCISAVTERWRFPIAATYSLIRFSVHIGSGPATGRPRDTHAIIQDAMRTDAHLAPSERDVSGGPEGGAAGRRSERPLRRTLQEDAAAASVQGALDVASVRRVVRRRVSALQRCIDRATARSGEDSGQIFDVRLVLSIDTRGRVAEGSTVVIPAAPPAAVECSMRALRRLRFPRGEAASLAVLRYRAVPDTDAE